MTDLPDRTNDIYMNHVESLEKRITELEEVLDRCREPVAYASDRAYEHNAGSLSGVYASIVTLICRVLSEGGADE